MNYILKKREMNNVFQELVSKYQLSMNEIAYEPQQEKTSSLIAKLYMTEDFLIDLQFIKGDLFRQTRKNTGTTVSYGTNEIIPIFKVIPSVYARKWHPFYVFFYEFDEKTLMDYSLLVYALIETLRKYKKTSDRIENLDILSRKNSVSNILKFESMKSNFFRMDVDNYEEDYALLVNDILHNFKESLKVIGKKISEENIRYRKRKNEYENYIHEIIDIFGEVCAISIDFWCDNDGDLSIGDLKKMFLNNIRSLSVFDCIKGYIGNWDFSIEKKLYFRCIFFVYNYSFYDVEVVQKEIINYWEQGLLFNSEKNISDQIIMYANSSFLAYSSNKLKKSTIVSKEEGCTRFINEFYDIVLNYIVVSEKYFYPSILRVLLLDATSKTYKEKIIPQEKLLLDKYGASRSFRGHLRKPKN